jgi:hypothetical protein
LDIDRKLDYIKKIQVLGITRGQIKFLEDAAKRIALERKESVDVRILLNLVLGTALQYQKDKLSVKECTEQIRG